MWKLLPSTAIFSRNPLAANSYDQVTLNLTIELQPPERFWDSRSPANAPRPSHGHSVTLLRCARNGLTARRMRLHMATGYGPAAPSSLRPHTHALPGLSATGSALPWRTATVTIMRISHIYRHDFKSCRCQLI